MLFLIILISVLIAFLGVMIVVWQIVLIWKGKAQEFSDKSTGVNLAVGALQSRGCLNNETETELPPPLMQPERALETSRLEPTKGDPKIDMEGKVGAAESPDPSIISSTAAASAAALTLTVFFSYAHEDESLRDKLAKHLRLLERQHIITGWHDRRISAGTEWGGDIDIHLNTDRIILLLVSPDFIDSDYCYDVEMQQALERHRMGEARVIPIILRPVDWTGTPFSTLQALPKDAKPITMWPNEDEAFFDVARGIRLVAEELRRNL